ncbi:MAG: adenosylcobinamide-phosphate synthase CbiB [Spirochaetota bacterium]
MPAVNITVGFILDLIFGDPRGFPHSVKFIGKLISLCEKLLLRKSCQRAAGAVLVVIVISAAYSVTAYLSALSLALEIFFIYTIFAVRSLSSEAMKVHAFLAAGDDNSARVQVSYLVSRDTAGMDRSQIIRAAVETVTENIVDGVISPMFYLFLGGAPLGMAYKAANTIDSMIGYRNEKYLRFGWAGARLDDLLNFIPARITGFILIPAAAVFTGGSVRGAYRILLRDRYHHSSPNSGHPESAAAGALGIRLGGPVSYFGVLHNKPYIGESPRDLEPDDIVRAVRLLHAASFTGLVLGWAVVIILFYLR